MFSLTYRAARHVSVCWPQYPQHPSDPFIQHQPVRSRWPHCHDASTLLNPSHKQYQHGTSAAVCCCSWFSREDDSEEAHRLWDDETQTVSDTEVCLGITLHVRCWHLMQKPLRQSLVHVQPQRHFSWVCTVLGLTWRYFQGCKSIPSPLQPAHTNTTSRCIRNKWHQRWVIPLYRDMAISLDFTESRKHYLQDNLKASQACVNLRDGTRTWWANIQFPLACGSDTNFASSHLFSSK